MDIQVLLEGTDISNYVISYVREHKICTAIGTLELVLSDNYTGDIFAWDTIEIYESSVLSGRYFVSSEARDLPASTRTISAQDNSKRLTDYFIPDYYTVDYPSNALYWIEKFLTEVGITYTIQEGVQGRLLNNNSSLGHMTAYEQIVELLQLCGLYITFDITGNASVGRLNKDLSAPVYSLDDTDILTIGVIQNDKMLRNRAVVWGAGSPSEARWVYADVRTQTRWNYDENDVRTAVLSNSYIYNTASAYTLANIMITEFSRLTVVKEVKVVGTTGVNLGDIIAIDSATWTGTGMVTTLTVDMNSQGLTTTFIVDERCPRIFGWFGLLDKVYVGTDGAGVWRKPIDINEPQIWEDFSTGLNDLVVTDLFKSNGLLSCVTGGGSLYAASEFNNTWSLVPLEDFPVVVSGEGYLYNNDILARATTHDRKTNYIHVACDNDDRPNIRDYIIIESGYGDYFVSSGSYFSWVAEINPATHAIIDTHQITVSGYDNITVHDIENDGNNDYVSVIVTASGGGNDLPYIVGDEYSFGYNRMTRNESTGAISFPERSFSTNDSWLGTFAYFRNGAHMFTIDNTGEREVAWVYGTSTGTRYFQIYRLDISGASVTSTSKYSYLTGSFEEIIGIAKVSTDIYRVVAYGDYSSIDNYFSPQHIIVYTLDVTAHTTSVQTFDESTSDYGLDVGYIRAYGRMDDVLYFIKEDYKNLSNYQYVPDYGLLTLITYDMSTDSYSKSLLVDPQGDSTNRKWFGGCYGPGGNRDYSSPGVWSQNGERGLLYRTNYIEVTMGDAGISNARITPVTILGNGQIVYHDSYYKEWESDLDPWWFVIGTVPVDGPYLTGKFNYIYYTGQVSSNLTLTITSIGYPGAGTDNGLSGDYYNYFLNAYPSSTNRTVADLVAYGGMGYGAYDIFYNLTGQAQFPIRTGDILTEYVVGADINDSYTPPTNWALYNIRTYEKLFDITPAGYTIWGVVDKPDSIDESIYFVAKEDSSGHYGLLGMDSDGNITKFLYSARLTSLTKGTPGIYRYFLQENFLARVTPIYDSPYIPTVHILYLRNQTEVPAGATFPVRQPLVLKRIKDDFEIVYSGIGNYYRLDLSEQYPLPITQSGENSFAVIDNQTTFASYPSSITSEILVNDFRFTHVDEGGETQAKKLLYYTVEKELKAVDISNINNIDYNNAVLVYNIDEGMLGKVETSNLQLPYQYLFVSTENNGISSFFQTDPTISGMFTEYNVDLPETLINVIRLDDRV